MARNSAGRPFLRSLFLSAPCFEQVVVAAIYDRRKDESDAAAVGAQGTPLRVHLGGEETVRVAIRRANFEKIAHKVERMGDYKPEFVYETAGVVELDPRDDCGDCCPQQW